MVNKTTLQFAFAELKLTNGKIVTMPFSYPETVWIGETMTHMSDQFARAMQTSLVEKGEYLEVLKITTAAEFQQKTVEVDMATEKQKKLEQHHFHSFDYFYWSLTHNQTSQNNQNNQNNQNKQNGYLALIPVLGIEVYSYLEEDLAEKIAAAIKLEFVRKKRLKDIHRIIEVQWFDQAVADIITVDVVFYTPLELEQLNRQKKRHVLNDVANKIVLQHAHLSGLKTELSQLKQTLTGEVSPIIRTTC